MFFSNEELWAIKMSLWAYRNFLLREKINGNGNVKEREETIKKILLNLENV